MNGLTRPRWRGRHTALSLCLGSYFAVRFAQVVVGPIVPGIIETFGVSRGDVGAALTAMWITYALSQLPSGMLADRLGERRTVLVALGTTAGATVGLAVAPAFALFVVAVAALGVGAGLYYNPATSLLAREFDSLGRVVGTHRVGGQVAGIVAPLAATVVGHRHGWRGAVAVGAAATLSAALLFLGRADRTPPARPTASIRGLLAPGALAALASRRHTRYTTLMATLVEFTGLAAMSFLPVFLIEHHGLGDAWANSLLAGFFAVTALTQPLGGWLSDVVGRDATIAFQATAGVVGFGALAVGGGATPVLPAVGLAGVAMSSTPVIQSRMLSGLSDADQGTGFGLFRTVYLLVGASGTVVVGTTADIAGWGLAFGLLAASFAALLVCVPAARRGQNR